MVSRNKLSRILFLIGATFVFSQVTIQTWTIVPKYDDETTSLLDFRMSSSSLSSSDNTSVAPAITTNSKTPTLSAAVCHRALFGTPDLYRVKHWVEYNHNLGFSHIYMWYLPGIDTLPGFQELSSLPYVTMQVETIVETAGVIQRNTWKNVNQEHESQRRLITQCLNNEASGYDWVLFADADEFLWYNQPVNLQAFLAEQQYTKNMTYLSFGKQEYTVSHAVSPPSTQHSTSEVFGGLGRFAFTAGSYCRPPTTRKANGLQFGDSYCPANRGRSKVLLRPKYYNYTDIHGITKHPNPKAGMIHFNTDVARFNEFVGMHVNLQPTLVSVARDFIISKENSVSVHQPKRSFKANANGTYTMVFDKSLQPWMDFVANLTPPPS